MAKEVSSLFPEINSLIKHHEKIVPSVSQRSIGWQLDHALKVIISVCSAVPKSQPEKFKPKLSILKSAVFITGFIPRGKGKAPKIVIAETVSENELFSQLETAKETLSNLDRLSPNNYFRHQVFGHLKVKDAKRFLYIHTLHHLKIARDILKG